MRTVSVGEYGVTAEFEVHSFGAGAPHVFFTAGIHGNEVTGVYVARRLIEYLTAHPPLRGSVTVIPTVNATALRCMQRRSPFDGEDLNRIFPGRADGTLSHRLAAAVWAETEPADLVVDLHCCGQHGLPYLLSIYPESPAVRDLVRRITMPVAVQSEGTGGQLFTESVRRRGQSACIIELPSGAGDGAVNAAVGDRCFAALLDLLRTEGVTAGAVEGEAPAFYGKLLDAETPLCGLWRPAVARGESVTAGQTLGTVEGVPVPAPADGFVMSALPCGYLRPGDGWVMTYIQPER
jgi:predicted deacylase